MLKLKLKVDYIFSNKNKFNLHKSKIYNFKYIQQIKFQKNLHYKFITNENV